MITTEQQKEALKYLFDQRKELRARRRQEKKQSGKNE